MISFAKILFIYANDSYTLIMSRISVFVRIRPPNET
jgi:hypothetical protein